MQRPAQQSFGATKTPELRTKGTLFRCWSRMAPGTLLPPGEKTLPALHPVRNLYSSKQGSYRNIDSTHDDDSIWWEHHMSLISEPSNSEPVTPRKRPLVQLLSGTAEQMRTHPVAALVGFVVSAAAFGWQAHAWVSDTYNLPKSIVDRDYLPSVIVRENYFPIEQVKREFVPRAQLADMVARSDLAQLRAENQRLSGTAHVTEEMRSQLESTLRTLIETEKALKEAQTQLAALQARQSAAEARAAVAEKAIKARTYSEAAMKEIGHLRADLRNAHEQLKGLNQTITGNRETINRARVLISEGHQMWSEVEFIPFHAAFKDAIERIASSGRFAYKTEAESYLASFGQPPQYFAELLSRVRRDKIGLGSAIAVERKPPAISNQQMIAASEARIVGLTSERDAVLEKIKTLQLMADRLTAAFVLNDEPDS